jgi:hypothetical protein
MKLIVLAWPRGRRSARPARAPLAPSLRPPARPHRGELCERDGIELYASYRIDREAWTECLVRAGVGLALSPEHSLVSQDTVRRDLPLRTRPWYARAMLVCHGCHRHIRSEEKACPFCGTSIQTMSAPAPARLGAMVFAVGLGLLGCTDKGSDDSMETETGMETSTTATSMPMTETGMETSTGDTSTGDGDGDGDTEESGADYGGPTTLDETGDGDGDGDGDEGDGDGDGDGDTMGDGDGDGDESGADYGGAPPVDPAWKAR